VPGDRCGLVGRSGYSGVRARQQSRVSARVSQTCTRAPDQRQVSGSPNNRRLPAGPSDRGVRRANLVVNEESRVGLRSKPPGPTRPSSSARRAAKWLSSTTIVSAPVDMGKPFLSQQVIKAFNFLAIVCLHTNAGEYRPCPVTVGAHIPPAHYRVPALMDDFVNTVNRTWEQTDPVVLATYVLWRVNNIHPFINGNGRTARAPVR
jgi:Fic/DOC family